MLNARTTFSNVNPRHAIALREHALGIVANGGRSSELYSKYTYYYLKTE